MTDKNQIKGNNKAQIEDSYCFEITRQYDPDRFLTSLFAPDFLKEDLYALYAFNYEIAKISETVSEAMLGEIRLQWWRESIDAIYNHIKDGGKTILRKHDVMLPLTLAIEKYNLPKNLFDDIIEGRTDDLYPKNPETIDALESYIKKTSSSLTKLTGLILGCGEEKALEELGTAWGMLGVIRAVPYQASLNKIFLPDDVMTLYGLSNDDIHGIKDCDELKNTIRAIDQKVEDSLKKIKKLTKNIKRSGKSIFLLTSLIKSYRKELKKSDYNPFKLDKKPNSFPRNLRLLYSAIFGII